jgi:hypothetical protein
VVKKLFNLPASPLGIFSADVEVTKKEGTANGRESLRVALMIFAGALFIRVDSRSFAV